MGNSEEPLTIRDCLDDFDFQDWLVSTELMQRQSLPPEAYEYTGETRGREHIVRKIYRLLHGREGYIIPLETIADTICYHHKPADLITVNNGLRRLREVKLAQPDYLFYKKGIGAAFGVTEFRLAAIGLKIVYTLRQSFDANVPETILAEAAYDASDVLTVAALRRSIAKLSYGPLRDGPLTIAQTDNDGSGQSYRLSYTQDAQLAPPWPAYLNLGYQQWLAGNEINILSRWDKRLLQQQRELDRRRKEDRLLELLYEHRGFIVPYGILSHALYGTANDRHNVESRLSDLKLAGKVGADDVFALKGAGLGFGVKGLALTVRELHVLQIVWKSWRDNEPSVPLGTIAQEVFGGNSSRERGNASYVISQVNKILKERSSRYIIHVIRKFANSACTLIETERTGPPDE